jgi:hypothetical protein
MYSSCCSISQKLYFFCISVREKQTHDKQHTLSDKAYLQRFHSYFNQRLLEKLHLYLLNKM